MQFPIRVIRQFLSQSAQDFIEDRDDLKNMTPKQNS